ncbi:hypothetical protein [Pseudoxanthomonas sp. OG2]|uniref:hypothetical protein n=1 Tax=Pseudoxanthomonas sp. OG2 TaxID=2587011 RepID=UPI0012EF1702|nr:hypothetical protein [Pseudoxanthomonas sp. OG2]ECH9271755.1 hypothetical protein [Salmonella enterica subsp. enterica serovar Litchfield]MBB3277320.1 hypothetical protein [Pseudoxanthomonas sp. OG2]
MNPAFFPYNDEGFSSFQAWCAEAMDSLSAMRHELERRHQLAGRSLEDVLLEHTPEGCIEAVECFAEDMKCVESDPSPSAFYRFQVYSRARLLMQAQIYQLELDRTES